MNDGIKSRKPLNGFHQRKARGHNATIQPNVPLPDVDTLAAAGASPALLDAVRTWHQLIDSEREQARAARIATEAVAMAETDHRRAVREAMSAGADPSTVKSKADDHKAAAAAHEGFYNDARNARQRLGVTLGPMLEDEAARMAVVVDEEIEKAAAAVRKQLNAMTKAWGAYGKAFELRRWLSCADLNGGSISAWHGEQPMPNEAAVGIAAIDRALGELDRLRSDEEQVREYRAAN